ncbi:MAG: heme ABC exporter ATP-binding protein CcmA [Acidobacteria bacterium]|nr:heme ABC exporter ATP-binding protein CcmA [Acidobacteriota bacterium]
MQIHARHLTKLYGDFPAVQNLSFEVASGEFVALLGRNGAGKTTLLKMLALLTRPSAGELRFGAATDNDATVGDDYALRGRIGLLGHNTFLYDELSAEENLRFYGGIYGISNIAAAISGMLEKVGLAQFSRELVRNYSRGMRQRLSIARLFLTQPELILLDEPFTGLDDRATEVLENMLSEAAREKRTIVLCTHQLDLALKHATRLLILERGKAAFLGPNDPEHLPEMYEVYRRHAG